MVNSVSSVSPANTQVRAMDKVSQEQLYAPGMYSVEELMEPPHYREKNGGFLGFLGNLALTTIIVAGGSALLRKHALSKIDIVNKPEKLTEQAKFYIAKIGEYVNEKILSKLPKFGKEKDAEPVKK